MAPDDHQQLAAALTDWFDAFNARDLDAILAGTAPDVRLYPLPLSGLQRTYRGHDGLRRWFVDIADAGHTYAVELKEFKTIRPGELVGIGEMRFTEGGDPFPFWARDLFEDGLIKIAHHYLSDPDIGSVLLPL